MRRRNRVAGAAWAGRGRQVRTWAAVEAALQGRPGWRRIGVEWHGPCPVTLAGRDGAWFGAGSGSGGVRCGCRHCGDAGGRLEGEVLTAHLAAVAGGEAAPRGSLRAVKRLPRSTDGLSTERTHSQRGRRGGGPGRGRLARRCRGGRNTGRGLPRRPRVLAGAGRGAPVAARSRGGADRTSAAAAGRGGRGAALPLRGAGRGRHGRGPVRSGERGRRADGVQRRGRQAAVSDRIGLRRRPARVRGAIGRR